MQLGVEFRGLIVSLPEAVVDDYVAVVEVLVQEGLPNFCAPVHTEGFAYLRDIFGPRARFGVSGVTTAADVARAAELNARFILADVAQPEIAAVAVERGLPSLLPAMTPTEVRAVLTIPGAGVLFYPADVVGHVMGLRLAALCLVDQVVPAGGLSAYAASEWLGAGAPAACVDSTLLGDAFAGGSLAKLRDRSKSFVATHRRATGAQE